MGKLATIESECSDDPIYDCLTGMLMLGELSIKIDAAGTSIQGSLSVINCSYCDIPAPNEPVPMFRPKCLNWYSGFDKDGNRVDDFNFKLTDDFLTTKFRPTSTHIDVTRTEVNIYTSIYSNIYLCCGDCNIPLSKISSYVESLYKEISTGMPSNPTTDSMGDLLKSLIGNIQSVDDFCTRAIYHILLTLLEDGIYDISNPPSMTSRHKANLQKSIDDGLGSHLQFAVTHMPKCDELGDICLVANSCQNETQGPMGDNPTLLIPSEKKIIRDYMGPLGEFGNRFEEVTNKGAKEYILRDMRRLRNEAKARSKN